MIKKIFFTILLLTVNCFAFSQNVSRESAERLYGEKKFQEAKNMFDQVIKQDPGDFIAYYDRAVTEIELKQLDKALNDINKSIELSPRSIKLYCCRSIIYGHLGNYEKSIEDADYVISKARMYADAYNQRGYVYIQLKEFEKAKEDFDNAILYQRYSKGGVAPFYLNRAVAYAGLGNFELALSDVNFVIQLNPSGQFNYIFKLYLLKMLNHNDEFDDTLLIARNLFPDNMDILTFELARAIEKVDIPKITEDIKELSKLGCNTLLYHKLLKTYYLLSNDKINYLKEVEILKYPEKLEDGGDLNIVSDGNSKLFFDVYSVIDPDIIFTKEEKK